MTVDHKMFIIDAEKPWRKIQAVSGVIRKSFFYPSVINGRYPVKSRLEIGKTAFFVKGVADNRRLGRLAQIMIQPRPNIIRALGHGLLVDFCIEELKGIKIYKNQKTYWRK